MSASTPRPLRVLGRYALYDEIAAGGMATVHIGRLVAAAGFARTVAIKRLHPNVARDPEFATMFLDEARLAARIRHPNVIQTLDVVALDGELFLVMEYVHGESLAAFTKQARRVRGRVPVPIATHVVSEVLHGLHAAHEAKNERGEPLGIVHRDVSPQNILVGVDGISRVFDFGIAKSLGRLQSTREGQVKGKLGYMAPEHFRAEPVTRRSDIYAAGIVLWEAVTGERLFGGASEAEIVYAALHGEVRPASSLNAAVPAAVDAVIARALERDPARRFATAEEMARWLETACPPVSKRLVADWVITVAPPTLGKRAAILEAIESLPADALPSLAPADAQPAAAAADDPGRDADGSRPRGSLSSESGVLNAARTEAPLDIAPEELPAFRRGPSLRRIAIGAGLVAAGAIAVTLLWGGPSSSPNAAIPSSAPAAPPAATVAPADPPPSATAADVASAESPPPSASASGAPASASTAPASAAASGAPTAPRPTGSAPAKKRARADELLGRD